MYKSHGMLKARLEFGDNKSSIDTFNPKFDFGKAFEANGTYVLERVYCKQRSKRSLVFADLTSYNIQKRSLTAIIDLGT